METRLNSLMKLLKQYIGYYEKVSMLVTKEKEALIEMDLDRLHKIAKAKETMCLKIKLVVPGLSEAIKEAAIEQGLPADPMPTLAELAKTAPEPYSRALEKSGAVIASLKRNITDYNAANHTFIQEALDLVNGSLAILTGAALAPKKAYTQTGQHAPASNYGPVKLSREV